MLSVLIPVYNQTVVTLVKEICKQCEEAEVDFQVLVFDDGSTQDIRDSNEELSHEFGVNYVELSENIGRAKIRNRLAKMARYKYLIFLDGDSRVVRDDFIKTYLHHGEQHHVVYGGRVYQQEVPKDEMLRLHWNYGRTREALPAKKRTNDPYRSFQSNNFLVHDYVFKMVEFDTEIMGYGYEDILFADKLKEKGIAIRHIDNPVLHDGLEPAAQFVDKTKNAIKNLVSLNNDGLLQGVRLTAFYKKAEGNNTLGMIKRITNMLTKNAESELNSGNQSVRKFNLWKLSQYIKYLEEDQPS